jgi:uncharacterized membrane protein
MAPQRSLRRLPRPLRFAHLHVRLLISLALGAVLIVALRGWPVSTRLLIAWDTAAGLYLSLTFAMMVRSDVDLIRRRAEAQDEGAAVILVATAAAALASLAAIFAELAAAKATGNYGLHAGLAVATILLSWVFTHTIFALHYAYEYYRQGGRSGGLKFPGNASPDYGDFMYFSLVIGMTSQVSDVAVTGKPIRLTVTAHGVFSFLFNTTIIALTVNIAGSVF